MIGSLRCAVLLFLLLGCLTGIQTQAKSAAEGYSSVALYNTANAYARAGKLGMAVVYYERAALLAPGDPDIERNLLIVRRSLGFRPGSKNPLERALGRVAPWTASWLGLIGLALVGSALIARRLTSLHRWAGRAAVVAGIALIGLTVSNGVVLWPGLHEAIVIAASAPVRVSPAPMGDTLFALKEAEAVRLAGEHEGFFLVRTSAGRTGWVWHADVVPVVPHE